MEQPKLGNPGHAGVGGPTGDGVGTGGGVGGEIGMRSLGGAAGVPQTHPWKATLTASQLSTPVCASCSVEKQDWEEPG